MIDQGVWNKANIEVAFMVDGSANASYYVDDMMAKTR